MRLRFVLPAIATAFLSTFGMTHHAQACGACIPPPSQSTVVTGHRMALSVSPKQTVLWDQIQYSGSPDSFAWVLPVKPGAIIQLSTDAWFETLDAATTTQIFQANVSCADSESSGFGCGSADFASRGDVASPSNAGGGPAVTVIHRGSVGPYETVTVSTDVPGALNTWLTGAGYAVDPSTQPVIDAYVAEGFDFIALKLKPDADVKAMKPVRVVQPGANQTLPLRMVAIGTGANVALTLFVIGEGRWEAKNFDNVVAPTNLLAWDFKTQSSNYAELRQKALGQNNGSTWLTSFAFQGALLGQLPALFSFTGTRTYGSPGGNLADTIASAYVQQGLSNSETTNSDCISMFANAALSTQMVSNPCQLDKPFDDPSCGNVAPGEIDARTLACGPLDDVAVAMNGLHPNDVWITRIEADLPRAALANDLIVQPAVDQKSVDNMVQATIATNVESFCGPAAVAPLGMNKDRSGPGGRGDLVVLVGLGLLSLGALARRRLAIA